MRSIEIAAELARVDSRARTRAAPHIHVMANTSPTSLPHAVRRAAARYWPRGCTAPASSSWFDEAPPCRGATLPQRELIHPGSGNPRLRTCRLRRLSRSPSSATAQEMSLRLSIETRERPRVQYGWSCAERAAPKRGTWKARAAPVLGSSRFWVRAPAGSPKSDLEIRTVVPDWTAVLVA